MSFKLDPRLVVPHPSELGRKRQRVTHEFDLVEKDENGMYRVREFTDEEEAELKALEDLTAESSKRCCHSKLQSRTAESLDGNLDMLDPLPTTSIPAEIRQDGGIEKSFFSRDQQPEEAEKIRKYEADKKEDDMKNARVRSPILDSPSTTQGVAEEVNGVPTAFIGPHPPSPDLVTNSNPSDAGASFDDGLMEAQEDTGIILSGSRTTGRGLAFDDQLESRIRIRRSEWRVRRIEPSGSMTRWSREDEFIDRNGRVRRLW